MGERKERGTEGWTERGQDAPTCTKKDEKKKGNNFNPDLMFLSSLKMIHMIMDIYFCFLEVQKIYTHCQI